MQALPNWTGPTLKYDVMQEKIKKMSAVNYGYIPLLI